MKFTRRDFVHAGCTMGATSLIPNFVDRAEAGLRLHGTPPVISGGLSQRSVININLFSSGTFEYPTINFLASGPNMYEVFGAAFSTTTLPVTAYLDADGWVNDAAGTSQAMGGAFFVPDPNNYGGTGLNNGTYIYQGIGNGVANFNLLVGNGTATWTQVGSATNCSITANSGGSFSVTSTGGASAFSIAFTFSNTISGPVVVQFRVTTTGTSGFFLKNLAVLQSQDATDFANGLIWRRAWKQPLVDLCPSVVRFMNVLGGNSSRNCRFENRTLPTNAAYMVNLTASPVYTVATGTNQFVCLSSPTTANPKVPATNMVHGEICCTRFTNGFRRVGSSNGTAAGCKVTSISNANPGVVTVDTVRPLNSLTWTGGVATLVIPGGTGWGVGDQVYFNISGATQTGYNGNNILCTCTVSGGASCTFTYPLASNPGASPATGSPSWAGHGYNTSDVIGHLMPQNAVNTSGTSNSTTTISSITTTNIVVGLYVYGTGIPANTTVTAVNSGASTITLSNSSTFTGSIELQFRCMQNLHQYPCTITLDPTNPATRYSIGIDTTSFGPFVTTGSPTCYQFATIQAGSGGDRGGIPGSPISGYPCTVASGNFPSTALGGFMGPNDTKIWYFDKTQSAQTDGSGNPLYGVWMFDAPGAGQPTFGPNNFPIEVCVALVNELNAMSPAHIIGMWMNIPVWGLSSMDPDYSSASDWAVNAVDVVMNPSSAVRSPGFSALGYSGSTQLNQPNLVLEYSNELWPSGTNGDGQGWLTNRSLLRWPTSGPWNNNQDYQDMKALRTTCFARDIAASNPPGLSRISTVIGLMGTQGLSPGAGGRGYETVFGGSVKANPTFTGDWYTNDPLVVTGSWGRPIDNCQGICLATYFDPPGNYHNTTSGTGTFTDDSAMFNGTDNSGTLSFTGGTGGVASKTLVTTAFPALSPVLHQVLVGSGISFPTTIVGISGTSPNFTLTLSQNATVANGTTITSPANGGGNYIGAANQSQALTNYANVVQDNGNINNESPSRYINYIASQVSAALPAGKYGICYEGGTDWRTFAGLATDSHTLTTGDSLFTVAVNNSSQWATIQINFMNTWCAFPNLFMPSIFIWIQAPTGNQQWAYCSPDTFALSGGIRTEGQALKNSAPWVAMSSRNVSGPTVVIPPAFNYVAEGDSITAQPGINGVTGYAQQYKNNNTFTTFYDFAVAGNVVADVISRAAIIDAKFLPGKNNALSVFVGTNDIVAGYATYGSQAATLLALSGYLDARRAVGWKVAIVTTLPRNVTLTPTFETQRGTWNSTLASWIGVHADALMDFGADAIMGNAANVTNLTYYQSGGIHPTQAGQDILAKIAAPILAGL